MFLIIDIGMLIIQTIIKATLSIVFEEKSFVILRLYSLVINKKKCCYPIRPQPPLPNQQDDRARR